MKKENGFSVHELMVVVAIVAIVAAIVTPGFLEWRSRSRLQGYANNLKADFELAKMRAIRENADVVVVFNQPKFNGYRIYVDKDANKVLRDVQFPDGLIYDSVDSTFVGHKTRFSPRGTTGMAGTAVLMQQGDTRRITVNRIGRITLQ